MGISPSIIEETSWIIFHSVIDRNEEILIFLIRN